MHFHDDPSSARDTSNVQSGRRIGYRFRCAFRVPAWLASSRNIPFTLADKAR